MSSRRLNDVAGAVQRFVRGLTAAVACAFLVAAVVARAETAPAEPGGSQRDTMEVIGAFAKGDDVKSEVVAIPDQKKRLIMFLMGVPLLIFILITAGLGVALGVYGKPVYLPHMIFAGLSVTLAIAHAVVGIVWFYPF
jgi:hypothetical protein